MAVPESKLPASQIAKRERLAAEMNAANPPTDAPPISDNAPPTDIAGSTPPPTTVVTTPPADNLGEIERLRAELATERGRAEVQKLELQEAELALTSLREASKGSVTAPPAPSPGDRVVGGESGLGIDPGDTEFDPQQTEDFSDAIPAVTKIANRQIANLVNPQLDALARRLGDIEKSIGVVTETTARQTSETFLDKVQSAVPEFDAIVNNPDWNKFLDNNIPGAGTTYLAALGTAHHQQKLSTVKEIFDAFKAKHPSVSTATKSNGFAGLDTTTGGGTTDTVSGEKPILKMSDRRKASEDFLKQRITQEELQKVKDDFTLADSEGRVDYNN